MLSTDLSHFEGTEPDIHPAAWKLAEQLRGIIRAATALPAGRTLESALPCRRRPRHWACPGWIRIVRRDVPPHILWECSTCEDSGLIHGWEDSPYDLRPRRSVPEQQALRVIELTAEEHAELRRLELLDSDSERLVWGASRDGNRVLPDGTEDDLDNLAGFVAFEANRLEDRRRQRRLDEVLRKLEAALGSLG